MASKEPQVLVFVEQTVWRDIRSERRYLCLVPYNEVKDYVTQGEFTRLKVDNTIVTSGKYFSEEQKRQAAASKTDGDKRADAIIAVALKKADDTRFLYVKTEDSFSTRALSAVVAYVNVKEVLCDEDFEKYTFGIF